MSPANFSYEDCLLKHYVRTQGWLPYCKARKNLINAGRPANLQRKLRYFTFCAVGAVDVLMLDVAKILTPSASGKFDSVVFFEKDSNAIREVQRRIPGAIGFPGSFTDVVLAIDGEAGVDEEDYLNPTTEELDGISVRDRQRLLGQRRDFIRRFPFDVLNLDLQDFAFRPNDEFPGKIVGTLRKLLQWQKHDLVATAGKKLSSVKLESFTLMFTTQIGPPNISGEYTDMLENSLRKNIAEQPDLSSILASRTGIDDPGSLRHNNFNEFFKVGLPKIVAGLLFETDWHVDPDRGITIFEFTRTYSAGTYQMLHLVMDVQRQSPPLEKRAPNSGSPEAAVQAYKSVSRQIFERPVIQVTEELVTSSRLKPTLREIDARRDKYLSQT